MTLDEQRIREFAFQIWESEGRPVGQQERHWQMACKLAQAEAEAEAEAAPAPAAEKPAPAKPRRISKPKTVPLSDAEQPALLKKPRTPRPSAAKSPKP